MDGAAEKTVLLSQGSRRRDRQRDFVNPQRPARYVDLDQHFDHVVGRRRDERGRELRERERAGGRDRYRERFRLDAAAVQLDLHLDRRRSRDVLPLRPHRQIECVAYAAAQPGQRLLELVGVDAVALEAERARPVNRLVAVLLIVCRHRTARIPGSLDAIGAPFVRRSPVERHGHRFQAFSPMCGACRLCAHQRPEKGAVVPVKSPGKKPNIASGLIGSVFAGRFS